MITQHFKNDLPVRNPFECNINYLFDEILNAEEDYSDREDSKIESSPDKYSVHAEEIMQYLHEIPLDSTDETLCSALYNVFHLVFENLECFKQYFYPETMEKFSAIMKSNVSSDAKIYVIIIFNLIFPAFQEEQRFYFFESSILLDIQNLFEQIVNTYEDSIQNETQINIIHSLTSQYNRAAGHILTLYAKITNQSEEMRNLFLDSVPLSSIISYYTHIKLNEDYIANYVTNLLDCIIQYPLSEEIELELTELFLNSLSDMDCSKADILNGHVSMLYNLCYRGCYGILLNSTEFFDCLESILERGLPSTVKLAYKILLILVNADEVTEMDYCDLTVRLNDQISVGSPCLNYNLLVIRSLVKNYKESIGYLIRNGFVDKLEEVFMNESSENKEIAIQCYETYLKKLTEMINCLDMEQKGAKNACLSYEKQVKKTIKREFLSNVIFILQTGTQNIKIIRQILKICIMLISFAGNNNDIQYMLLSHFENAEGFDSLREFLYHENENISREAKFIYDKFKEWEGERDDEFYNDDDEFI